MYSVADYGTMIADPARMGAFRRALAATIRPGSVVVDLGAGTGIMALLACQLGARRVFAIEPDDAIQVAREISARNGFAGQIEFIQNRSTEIELPERADVIVSDIGGIMPWFQEHIPSIVDARQRFLRPGGVLIPARDDVWATVVEAPALYARKASPWGQETFGLDMTPARNMALNTWTRGRVGPDGLLSRPAVLASLDYQTLSEPHLETTATWTIDRHGLGHGILAGFDRTVAGGVRLSNRPGAADAEQSGAVYDTVFFPWLEPVPLDAGDVVRLDMRARLMTDDYVWTWNTDVRGHAGTAKASFRQSTFLGTPLSLETVKRKGVSHVPVLNEHGRIVQFILTAMGDGVPVGEIASRLSNAFPGRVNGRQDAIGRVTALTALYE